MIALLLPVALAAEVHRYALIAGANDGGSTRSTLRYAATDAQHMAAVLGELGGIRPADALLLTNPRRADIEAALRQLNQRVAADRAAARRTEVLFYYSGHSDETGLLLGPDRYPYKELRAAIDGLGADVKIAILDSCASGAMVREKGGTHVPAFLIDESSEVKGHAFLTSSSADEASQEADRIGASYFTHALVTGLRGGADRDLDGQVTLTEAYQFAYDETLRRTESTAAGAQHPAYDMRLVGTGDLVMTDLRQTSAALRFTPEVAGRLFIRDADGQLIAELSKTSGRELLLGLEPGTYTISREEGAALQTATVTVAAGAQAAVSRAAFGTLARSPSTARGEVPAALPREAVAVQVFPDLDGEDGLGLPAQTQVLALGLIAAGAEELDGWAFSLGANLYGRRAEGGVFAVGANLVKGELEGAAGSAGVNVIGGLTQGIAVAAGANLLGGDVQGGLGASGANIANADVEGVMVSGGVNLTRGFTEGVQGAGGVNLALAGLDGIQLAGGVNLSGGDADAVQIATVNIADRIDGMQIGVVNIAKDLNGVPIGLISYSGTGILAAELWTSPAVTAQVGVKMGARHVYNTAWVAGNPHERGPITDRSLGYGIGARGTFGRIDWDTDLAGLLHIPDGCDLSCPTTDLALRSSLSFAATPYLAPFVGGLLSSPLPTMMSNGQMMNNPSPADLRAEAFAGLRFARPPQPSTADL